MTDIIYEDLGKGCRYILLHTGAYEEIDTLHEKHYRGVRVSHGYMMPCTMENVLWADGLNDRPTIEDELLEAGR